MNDSHPRTKYIEPAWLRFETMVLPRDASAVQRSEMRKAFYGGAAILFRIITGRLEEGAEPTDADLRMMDDVSAEIDEYGEELDAAVFKGKGPKA